MFVFDSMHIFKFYVQFQTNLRQLTVNLCRGGAGGRAVKNQGRQGTLASEQAKYHKAGNQIVRPLGYPTSKQGLPQNKAGQPTIGVTVQARKRGAGQKHSQHTEWITWSGPEQCGCGMTADRI